MKANLAILVITLALTGSARAQSAGITGQWVEPSGSVIQVDHCGDRICVWIISLSKQAPSGVDIYNPDPAKRSRSLCGLEIGSGFSLRSPAEAIDGTLYDPKSGKTYHGRMYLNGKKLDLRGYIGIPLLGKAQTWTRPISPVTSCNVGPEGENGRR